MSPVQIAGIPPPTVIVPGEAGADPPVVTESAVAALVPQPLEAET